MTSAGLSYETHQNAEPFFVTEVNNLHSICLCLCEMYANKHVNVFRLMAYMKQIIKNKRIKRK